jgi:hypothetical protein
VAVDRRWRGAPVPRHRPGQPAGQADDRRGAKANNITYVKDKNLGQQQANAVKLPWRKDVTIESNGLFRPLSLVAQSASGGNGSITCRILDAQGQEITSSTSSGPYAVVTCSGR